MISMAEVRDYKELNPGEVAYYDGCIKIDLWYHQTL